MSVSTLSSISPFIKTSDFPIKFKIRESWFARVGSIDYPSVRNYPSVELALDLGFFSKINESKYVKRFLRSENYINAEKLFDLSETKKNLEKIFDTTRSYYDDIKDPITNIDLSCCFPFNSKIISTGGWTIKNDWNIKKVGFLFKMHIRKKDTSSSVENRFIPILGDLQSSAFYITKQSLKLLVLNNLFKIGLPHVPKDYISELLSSYNDLKYKYIAISKLNYKFFDKYVRQELLARLVYQFDNPQMLESRFFLQPERATFASRRSDVYSVKDNMIISLAFGVWTYIMIYSNEYPLKNKIIRNFKDASHYFADSWVILEIKKK